MGRSALRRRQWRGRAVDDVVACLRRSVPAAQGGSPAGGQGSVPGGRGRGRARHQREGGPQVRDGAPPPTTPARYSTFPKPSEPPRCRPSPPSRPPPLSHRGRHRRGCCPGQPSPGLGRPARCSDDFQVLLCLHDLDQGLEERRVVITEDPSLNRGPGEPSGVDVVTVRRLPVVTQEPEVGASRSATARTPSPSGRRPSIGTASGSHRPASASADATDAARPTGGRSLHPEPLHAHAAGTRPTRVERMAAPRSGPGAARRSGPLREH
ncbi:hypothetical protein KPP03845_100219 [Streptomyces xanthophaeus]|nr:hypothetical protein KPP03845_100219 [Streptomyces xanthophaeus]